MAQSKSTRERHSEAKRQASVSKGVISCQSDPCNLPIIPQREPSNTIPFAILPAIIHRALEISTSY